MGYMNREMETKPTSSPRRGLVTRGSEEEYYAEALDRIWSWKAALDHPEVVLSKHSDILCTGSRIFGPRGYGGNGGYGLGHGCACKQEFMDWYIVCYT